MATSSGSVVKLTPSFSVYKLCESEEPQNLCISVFSSVKWGWCNTPYHLFSVGEDSSDSCRNAFRLKGT